MRNCRLHRSGKGIRHPDRGVAQARVPRIRLRGHRRAHGRRRFEVIRREGKVEELERACAARELPATMGHRPHALGNSRRLSETNAHPHIDCEGKIAIVHNGIIENYVQLRDELKAEGTIVSQRDRHRDRRPPAREVLRRRPRRRDGQDRDATEGAYGIAAIHVDHPDQIVVTRGQPHRRRLRGRAAGDFLPPRTSSRS